MSRTVACNPSWPPTPKPHILNPVWYIAKQNWYTSCSYLDPLSSVLCENLAVIQHTKKSATLYKALRFINMFSRCCDWSIFSKIKPGQILLYSVSEIHISNTIQRTEWARRHHTDQQLFSGVTAGIGQGQTNSPEFSVTRKVH